MTMVGRSTKIEAGKKQETELNWIRFNKKKTNKKNKKKKTTNKQNVMRCLCQTFLYNTERCLC